MIESNVNPIVKRIAVKADCEFVSPALIGSGYGENTDSDIVRDASGNPFLPGSTVAGVLHSLCPFALFGIDDRISPLWVLDSELDGQIIELDGVALDRETKVALEQKKYDYEAIATGAKFTLRLLLTVRENDNTKNFEDLLKKLIGAVTFSDLSFGAKTRRGFGRVKCNAVSQREFDLSPGDIDMLNEWIAFDWNNAAGFTPAESESFCADSEKLTVRLKIDGSIMIRDTRNIYEGLGVEEKEPDYKHISINGKPVIPGTAWAGAFRSGLYRLLGSRVKKNSVTAYLDDVFGFVKENNKKAEVSLITFGASTLEPIDKKTDGYRSITRVKIDRFTGGTADGALFTEKPWFGGETTLEIRYPSERDDIKELLLLAIEGIDKGLIQIGGETAIGRGFLKVLSVNGESLTKTAQNPKQNLAGAIEKAGKK
jgi:CRISPR/Cas system CSM-associated protein Csm3 (group 7 of RAMP superfamily)